MGKRETGRFLESYALLECALCDKLKIEISGVGEYINRLGRAEGTPGVDEALSRLVRYRGVRNRLVHEPTARGTESVARRDTAWLRRFRTAVRRSRDPLSLYLRGVRRARLGRYAAVFLLGALIVLLALAAVVILGA